MMASRYAKQIFIDLKILTFLCDSNSIKFSIDFFLQLCLTQIFTTHCESCLDNTDEFAVKVLLQNHFIYTLVVCPTIVELCLNFMCV